jgi:aspartate/methionine/tyrosine aminotransferase
MIPASAVVSRATDRVLHARHGKDGVSLGGSPLVRLPPHVVDGGRSAAEREGTAPAGGEPALREAIAERFAAEGITSHCDQVLVTNGAMQALDICFRTLLRRGGEVLCPEPRFFIDGLVERAGALLVGFPSPENNGFRPDWDSAEQRVTPRTKVLFLNSPTNPTGYVYDADDIAAAVRLATEHDLWIVSDESYSHFVYRGRRHESVAVTPLASDRTIVIRSFSKDYAMPGWRIGYLSAPRKVVTELQETLEWSCLAVSRVGQYAALAALRGPREWIDGFVDLGERQSVEFACLLDAIPGLRCAVPAGGLNVLVGARSNAELFVRSLVLEAGVPAHVGEAFGAPGFFRMQCGATDDALQEAGRRVAAVAARFDFGRHPNGG